MVPDMGKERGKISKAINKNTPRKNTMKKLGQKEKTKKKNV